MDFTNYFKKRQEQINQTLSYYFPENLHNSPLQKFFGDEVWAKDSYEIFHYALFSSGKRIRPFLVLEAAHLFDLEDEKMGKMGKMEKILPVACAVEILHNYTLVHDDIIDEDDLRRGKPTIYKKYGIANAILIGDELFNCAIKMLTIADLSNEIIISLINELLDASSLIVLGQVLDIKSDNNAIPSEKQAIYIEVVNKCKTARLLAASMKLGAIASNAQPEQIKQLYDYGTYIGIAFQIMDDILDVIGDSDTFGKPIGSDERRQKVTYVSVFGLEEAKKKAKDIIQKAINILEPFGEKAQMLKELANYIIERKY